MILIFTVIDPGSYRWYVLLARWDGCDADVGYPDSVRGAGGEMGHPMKITGYILGNRGDVTRSLEVVRRRSGRLPAGVFLRITGPNGGRLAAMWLDDPEARQAGAEILGVREDLRMILPRVALQNMTEAELAALIRLRALAENMA